MVQQGSGFFHISDFQVDGSVTRNAESISEQFCLLLTNLKNVLAVFYDYGQQENVFSLTKCLYVTAFVVII